MDLIYARIWLFYDLSKTFGGVIGRNDNRVLILLDFLNYFLLLFFQVIVYDWLRLDLIESLASPNLVSKVDVFRIIFVLGCD